MNIAQVLIFLSDPDRMREFLDAIYNDTYWDQTYDMAWEDLNNREWAKAAEGAGRKLLQESENGEQSISVRT